MEPDKYQSQNQMINDICIFDLSETFKFMDLLVPMCGISFYFWTSKWNVNDTFIFSMNIEHTLFTEPNSIYAKPSLRGFSFCSLNRLHIFDKNFIHKIVVLSVSVLFSSFFSYGNCHIYFVLLQIFVSFSIWNCSLSRRLQLKVPLHIFIEIYAKRRAH